MRPILSSAVLLVAVAVTSATSPPTVPGAMQADLQWGPAPADFPRGAEMVVMKGDINGTIDLSPAFQKDQPLGSITGRFTASGVRGTPMANERASGSFTGTFRIPFRHEGKPSYLLDDGSVVKAHPDELLFGQGMVRLEVSFTTQAKDSR